MSNYFYGDEDHLKQSDSANKQNSDQIFSNPYPESYNTIDYDNPNNFDLYLTPYEREFNIIENKGVDDGSYLNIFAPMDSNDITVPDSNQVANDLQNFSDLQILDYSNHPTYSSELFNDPTLHHNEQLENFNLFTTGEDDQNTIFLSEIPNEVEEIPVLEVSHVEHEPPSNEYLTFSPDPLEFSFSEESSPLRPESSKNFESPHLPVSPSLPSISRRRTSGEASPSNSKSQMSFEERQAHLRELNNKASREYRRRKKEKEREMASHLIELENSNRALLNRKEKADQKIEVLNQAMSRLFLHQKGGVLYK